MVFFLAGGGEGRTEGPKEPKSLKGESEVEAWLRIFGHRGGGRKDIPRRNFVILPSVWGILVAANSAAFHKF